MKHLNITITGRVQGVGFRYSARNVAMEYAISGFVRNISYNKVYIEAEGDAKNIETFLLWCHKGPDRAKVENVSVIEGAYENFPSFEVMF